MTQASPDDNLSLDIAYYAERIRTCLMDETLDWHTPLDWLHETLEDMLALATTRGDVTPDQLTAVRAKAQAMQAFIFHGGPDPDAEGS